MDDLSPGLPAMTHAADHDLICVRGANENNLKSVDIDLPKRRLTVFTGVSGSGKSSLVFEHKPETIAIADHVVGLGPGAGAGGGEVVFEGTVDGLRGSETLTGRHLDDRAGLKPEVRTPTGAFEVRGAGTNNLREVDVDLPLGVLVAITGVAGSGKSSLIHGSVDGRDGVVVIDQSAIKGSRRSNPATYTGLLEPIRTANGVKPALFSSNSEGACPTCNGAGVIFTELGIMATVESPCEDCEGRRFQAAVLDHELGGKNIAEVLKMSMSDAAEFFGGGETRIPSAHKILSRLVDSGTSAIAIEHHQAIMAHADWIIDLGPGAGSGGGRVVFEGPPAQLIADRSTLTGEHLTAYVGG